MTDETVVATDGKSTEALDNSTSRLLRRVAAVIAELNQITAAGTADCNIYGTVIAIKAREAAEVLRRTEANVDAERRMIALDAARRAELGNGDSGASR